jgi:Tfp pilus assembly major pilin PilA
MNWKTSRGGVSLSGLIYSAIIFAIIAVVGMKLFPLYNEKFKVDLALEKVAGQTESARMTKTALVKLVMRQFEVSEVRRWSMVEFVKVLKIKKLKLGKGKTMSLEYEIRGPFFAELGLVLKYEKSLILGKPVSD